MLTASIVTLAAVVLALQLNLPRLWSGFQIVGNGSGTYDFATNAVVLGTALIVFTTVVNALGVRLMTMINSAGVFIELIAACLIALFLAINIKRSPEVFFSAHGYGAGKSWGYLSDFLVASLASGYVMYGFDTASSLGEETLEPRRTAPRAILRAILASFVIGGAILVFAILAAPNLKDPQIASGSGGLQYIVEQVMWGPLGKLFLVCIVVAVTVCSLAVHTAAIRLTFAMARDNALPFGEKLARVNSQTQTPIVPAVVIGVIAELILVLNIGQPKIFTVLTSIAVIMIYLAYLLVTVPLLQKRLAGQWPPPDLAAAGYFTMGRWGMLVNIVAVLWGAGMALNLAWPREAVYGSPWYNTWGAFVYIAVILGAGLWWYAIKGRRHIGTLASHTLAASEWQVCRERHRDGDRAGPELARHVLVESHRDEHQDHRNDSGITGPREEPHPQLQAAPDPRARAPPPQSDLRRAESHRRSRRSARPTHSPERRIPQTAQGRAPVCRRNRRHCR